MVTSADTVTSPMSRPIIATSVVLANVTDHGHTVALYMGVDRRAAAVWSRRGRLRGGAAR